MSDIADKPISAGNLKAVLQDKSIVGTETTYESLSQSLKDTFYREIGLFPYTIDSANVSWAEFKQQALNIASMSNDFNLAICSDKFYKEATLSGYGTHKFVVVDTDAENNTITMQSLPLITKYTMNSSDTTSGGWASSAMRTWLNDTLLAAFPDDLKSAIKETTVKYDASTNGITSTCSDKLWLPSYQEVFGAGNSNNIKNGIEGTQFAYYANGGSKIKYLSSSAYGWWLRSVYNSTGFWFVNYSGVANGAGVYGASSSFGVAPCFCI